MNENLDASRSKPLLGVCEAELILAERNLVSLKAEVIRLQNVIDTEKNHLKNLEAQAELREVMGKIQKCNQQIDRLTKQIQEAK